MLHRICGGIVLVAVAVTGSAFAQVRKTIPQRLAEAGVDLVSGGIRPSGPTPEVESVIRDAQIIVRGTVGTPRTYLTEDQTSVLTDYPILNPRIMFESEVSSQAKPGAREIVVTLEGGTVSFAGLNYTLKPRILPQLEPGSEYVLLLKRIKNKLYVAGTELGAFAIKDGQLTPASMPDFAPQYRNVRASEAVDDIVARRHAIAP